MRLERLEISRLPGIEPGFEFRPAGGAATVVVGPNASGKSSLARALKALLYPDSGDGFCELSARLADGAGRAWQVRRQGEHSEWLREGEAVPPPELPAADFLDLFVIRSDDMVAAGGTEGRIAERLRTLLAGGYDLDGVLEQPPLKAGPLPRKRARELAELERAAEDLERRYADLAGALDRIGELEQAFTDSVAAGERLEACRRARELAGARREREAAAAALAEFPAGMECLRGDELDRLAGIDEREADKRRGIRTAHRQLDQAREALAETGIGDPEAAEVVRKNLADDRQRLAEIEERLAELRHAEQDVAAALAEARRRAGGEIDVPAAELDAPRLDTLDEKVDRVRNLRARFELVRDQHARLADRGAAGENLEPLIRACHVLREWLRHPAPTGPELTVWGVLLALGVSGTVTLLATGGALQGLLLIVPAVLAPLARLWGLLRRRQDAEAARRQYPSGSVEPPLGWTRAEVVARLEELDEELATTRQAVAEQGRFVSLREERARLEAELKQAEAELEAEADALGLSPRLRLTSGFLLWTRAVLDWYQAARRQAETRRHHEAAEDEREALLAGIRARFDEAGLDAPERLGAAELGRWLNQFGHALSQAHSAVNAIDQFRRRIDELEDDCTELAHDRLELYRQAGLRVRGRGDPETLRAELAARLERLPRFRELGEQQARLDHRIELHRRALEGEPELLELAESAASLEALARLESELAERAGRRDALNREITELKGRHRDALERRELEALNHRIQAAREELSEAAEAQLVAAAAGFLVERARTTHRERHQPRVLAQAAAWFGAFTRDDFSLVFDGREFAALDTRAGQRRRIHELSTGTRIQLLLAIRLAWIDEAEQGREALPVILDEVLSTTDPERYRIVVETVQDLVRAGRQVIYFSAQPADAEAWRRFAGAPAPEMVDMVELRRGHLQRAAEGFGFALPEVEPVPEPAGLSPEAWAEAAGVAPIDPWMEAGGINLFHLLRDRLEKLVELRRAGLESLGQLEAWLARSGPAEPAEAEILQSRVRAARAFLAHWRRGRGRPVTASVLAESGAVSKRFTAPVAALAEEVGGEPEALVEALREGRVARFRTNKIDELEQWLEEKGYLDTRPALDRPGLVQAMTEASGLPLDEADRLRAWLEAGLAPEAAAREAAGV